jgi:hypothetical protein
MKVTRILLSGIFAASIATLSGAPEPAVAGRLGPEFTCVLVVGGSTVAATSGSATPAICSSAVAKFYYNAHLEYNAAILEPPGGTYFHHWTVTSVQGPLPTDYIGCSDDDNTCDFQVTTTSRGNTLVDVKFEVANEFHSPIYSFNVRVVGPCTTIKPGDHPTLC